MAVYRCKMCGGSLQVAEGKSVCECEYCGLKQSVPKNNTYQKATLYDRANHLRRNNEYDKAAAVFERIVELDSEDAEAYWSLVLCRYGIEYVEDPETKKRIPTVNRTQYTSIYEDDNYKSAIRYADSDQKKIYQEEAKVINDIQKGILEISQKEEPFDVFICYKETDESGRRTQDSVLATELYHQLVQEGFKVFFSRITLEDKLGTAYEPYIFAALNSAKVMVVLGTKPEYFNAVWVKNEWGRYLALIKNGAKKVLVPAYRNMDPYDLPEEFSHLQAQDMLKLGFMQDLIRGIKKILDAENKPEVVEKETIIQQVSMGNNANVEALIERGYIALEDHEWEKADSFFEEVLNQNARSGEAYLGKLLVEKRLPTLKAFFKSISKDFGEASKEHKEACPEAKEHIEKIVKDNVFESYLGDGEIRKGYEFDRGYFSSVNGLIALKKAHQDAYSEEKLLQRARQYATGDFKNRLEEEVAADLLKYDEKIEEAKKQDEESIQNIKASYNEVIQRADKKAEELNAEARKRKDLRYQSEVASMQKAKTVYELEKAKKALSMFHGYADSTALIGECEEKIRKIRQTNKEERTKHRKKALKITRVVALILAACLLIELTVTKVIIPNNKYSAAVKLMKAGEYEEAIEAFETLGDYKDSKEQIEACKEAIKDEDYEGAKALRDIGMYQEAKAAFEKLGDHKDSKEQAKQCQEMLDNAEEYSKAIALKDGGNYEEASAAFASLGDFKDAVKMASFCQEEIEKMKAAEAEAKEAESKEAKEAVALDKAEVGEVVLFGKYEQDNDTSNGKEDIEWTVLDKRDNKLLIISKYALDSKPYHNANTEVTWESSYLREWLNSTFINGAFSDIEQNHITEESIPASNNTKYETDAGTDTKDKVFLLSATELNKYFKKGTERECVPTSYASARGAWSNDKHEDGGSTNTYWWLRTPGMNNRTAMVVGNGGESSYDGTGVAAAYIAVRPAIWVSIKAQAIDDFETVRFGRYEQDGNADNGKEDIEWLVLDKENNAALLVAKHGLIYRQVNSKYALTVWENNQIRKWLKNTFLGIAFSETEQNVIKTTLVKAESNPNIATYSGKDTEDKVFLLSTNEVLKYFQNENERICQETAYAAQIKAAAIKENTWWLRNTGSEGYRNCYCDSDGTVNTSGEYVNSWLLVRPAIWVDLSKMKDESKSAQEDVPKETVAANIPKETVTETEPITAAVAETKEEASNGGYQEYWLNPTDGAPEGEPVAVPFMKSFMGRMDGTSWNSITKVHLNNGYTRLCINYTVPEKCRVCVFDPPNGVQYKKIKTLSTLSGVIYCDINDEVFNGEKGIAISLFIDDANRTFATFSR